MKVAFIVTKGMPLGGGIEKYTEEVGSRLASRGHTITVYTMRHYGTVEGRYRGLNVRTVPTVPKRSLEKLIASLTATFRLCLTDDVDIVHMHAFGPAMWGFLARLCGKKVVTQGHGLEWKRSKWSWLGRTFLKLTEIPSVRSAHALTVVSRVQKKYLLDTYHRASTYIPTGVNPPDKVTPEQILEYNLQGNDYILFAARLVQEKGAHHLIKAFRSLADRKGKKLVIAGDAPYEAAYKSSLLALAGQDPDIIFTGFVTGRLLDELFSNCYLFVLPSEIEGLPTVLLEAMSYRNCCLVSDIPENLEALNDLGYTFRNKDIENLATMLEVLLNNPEKVDAVGESAREYVLKNFNWDDIAIKFEQFYQDLLEDKVPE